MCGNSCRISGSESYRTFGAEREWRSIWLGQLPEVFLGKLIPVKVAGDAEEPPVLRMTIDAPPDETREQWLARTARERGLPAPAIVGAAVGSANGGDSK